MLFINTRAKKTRPSIRHANKQTNIQTNKQPCKQTKEKHARVRSTVNKKINKYKQKRTKKARPVYKYQCRIAINKRVKNKPTNHNSEHVWPLMSTIFKECRCSNNY